MHAQQIASQDFGYRHPVAVPSESRQPDRLAALGLCQTFAAGTEIVAEEAAAAHVYQMISGAVRTVQIMEDGRRQIGSIHLPGDVFGLATGDHHTFAAEAMTDCAIVVIRRERLIGARTQDSGLSDALLQMTVAELERAQDRFTTLGRRTAIERVAWCLIEMSARLDSGDEIELPLSRQDMGDYLGLTIETVSRMMTELERRGIIWLRSSRRVVVSDRARLTQLQG